MKGQTIKDTANTHKKNLLLSNFPKSETNIFEQTIENEVLDIIDILNRKISPKENSTLGKNRASFNTLSTKDEIDTLKKGKLPPELIYVGEAGKKLLDIDKNRMHLYSLIVNNGISKMFIHESEFKYSAKELHKCLGKTNNRLDIGTGNGIVSNMVALSIVGKMNMARIDADMENFQKALQTGDISEFFKEEATSKPNFVCCDLSKSSLGFAEELANNHFHDLGQFFTLKYYPDTFQKFLQSNNGDGSPRLITMFNMLANYQYNDLKNVLTSMYDSMSGSDVFIPTFFLNDDAFQDYYESLGLGGFHLLSRALYYNKETKDRCISSFCDRYKIPKNQVVFNVSRNNDGRDFIDVSILVSPDAVLHIPQDNGKDLTIRVGDQLDPDNNGMVNFNVFKSYRMSQKQIGDLCESIGFKIDYRLDSGDGIQTAPVLYK